MIRVNYTIVHFVVLAEDAIKAALSDYRIKQQSKENSADESKSAKMKA